MVFEGNRGTVQLFALCKAQELRLVQSYRYSVLAELLDILVGIVYYKEAYLCRVPTTVVYG